MYDRVYINVICVIEFIVMFLRRNKAKKDRQV